MDILFDTSAINHSLDDPEGGAIVSGLLASGNIIHVSAISVVEAASTPDVDRRRALLRWMKFMTGEVRPLEMPNALILRAVAAYGGRNPSLDWSICREADVLWGALVDPESADDELREDLRAFQRSLKRDFRLCHVRARPHFQRLFNGTAPRHASTLLLEYLRHPDDLRRIVNDTVYRQTVGCDLPAEEIWELFRVVPEIAGFMLAWGHSVYRRAIGPGGGAHNNAGILDLWFATYLGRIDRFVTSDLQQYKALRLVAALVPDGRHTSQRPARRCAVSQYDAYRRGLLVSGRSPVHATNDV